ncbi:MAG TPA: chemotaxis protein CheA [Syntrophomonas sp.]|nr:chemotaxis protein CheA [Syntrophomonas sp.]
MDKDISLDPLVDMFIFETLQLTDQLEQLVLNSEKSNTFEAEEINEIFRIMHTIKGSAAMMMVDNISLIAHSMEDLMLNLRESGPAEMNYSKLCDLILNGIDFIKTEISKIREGNEADGIPDRLLAGISDYLSTLTPDNSGIVQPAPVPAGCSEPNRSVNENPNGDVYTGSCYKTVIFFEDECGMENMRAFNVVYKMEDLAAVIQYSPADIAENNDSCLVIRENGFEIEYSTDLSREDMEQFFLTLAFVERLETIELTGAKADKTMALLGAEGKNDSYIASAHESNGNNISSKQQSIISVQLNKLDKLMDLVGELVISGAMVTNNPDLHDLQQMENFNKAARQHYKIINELQDIVMSIRMVPLSGTFQKMNRVVRDMCKKLDKQVDLIIEGAETEVDKNIIEHLSDPIMHLIRNAVDHGVETAEVRLAKGKPASGQIRLEARNEGGDVWITVRDDGDGLNRDKILQTARERELIHKNESELSDQEIYEFILLPGFSTNDEVSEFSGRGVGMDVVVQNIEEVGGTVYIESKPDLGTAFIMKIPLTLAIIDGMGIRVGTSIYTVPITSIRESFKAGENEVFTDPDGFEMIMVRGECLPIVRLHKIYHIDTSVTNIHEGIIMIVETDNCSMCLFADELIGEQQVVVKALPKYLKKIKGIGGCTLLGDGRSSLILDIAGLANY